MYRAYLYIPALALFFIIGRVASFKVIPTWLNNTVPAMFPLLETVLELTFRYGLEYARRIIFNRRFVIESLSFEWFFEFWKQPKVTGGYVGTARRLSEQCDTVFTQKLLHKIRWMRWRVIVGVRDHFLVHQQLIDDHLQSQVAPAQYYPMFLSSKVGQNENHYQQKCGLLWNDYTTILFVFCSYTHSQRPSASSQ